MDRGAMPRAYRFTIGAKLPHNVMELTSHGGNTELVYPIGRNRLHQRVWGGQ